MKDKKKVIMIPGMIVALFIVMLAFSYAAFNGKINGTNSNLVLGDIYMQFKNSETLTIEDAIPGSDYTSYFEFTITGKNTYEKEDIWYDFSLSRGDVPNGKTEENRIPDKYLKFKLVSVDGDNETVLLEDETYDDLTNRRIYVETIPKNTTTEINKTY